MPEEDKQRPRIGPARGGKYKVPPRKLTYSAPQKNRNNISLETVNFEEVLSDLSDEEGRGASPPPPHLPQDPRGTSVPTCLDLDSEKKQRSWMNAHVMFVHEHTCTCTCSCIYVCVHAHIINVYACTYIHAYNFSTRRRSGAKDDTHSACC